jgi:hypothetical protein
MRQLKREKYREEDDNEEEMKLLLDALDVKGVKSKIQIRLSSCLSL